MRQRKFMNQINIVPYVDVMMVLLVIFMVTAPLVNPGVIDLPTVGKSSQQTQVVPPLEVIVRRHPSLMLREREPGAKEERDGTMPELIEIVKARQAARPDQPVVIAADKDVKYDAVLKVMDEMQKLDVKRVGLMVKPAAEK